MNRKSLAVLIVAVWIGSLGVLVARSYTRGESELRIESAQNVPPGAVFYSVHLGPDQVGYASSTVDTVPDGVFVQEIVEVRLPVGDRTIRVNQRTDAVLDPGLNLRHFESVIQGDDERARIEARVIGDSLTVAVRTVDGGHDSRLLLSPRVTLPSLVSMRLVFAGGIDEGATRTLTVLDPLTLKESELEVTVFNDSTFMVPDSAVLDSTSMTWSPVHYDTVHAWRTRYRSGAGDAEVWVDDLGRVLSLETERGYRLTRSVFEVVYENFRRRDTVATRGGGAPAGLSRMTALESGIQPDTVEEMVVRFSGRPPPGAASRTQLVDGQTVTVTTAAPPAGRPYRLGSTPPGMRRYMEPDHLVAGDDPRVSAQGRQIVGGVRASDPVAATVALVEWVSQRIARAERSRYPDAVRAILERSGDANDAATAFVAMARSVGIPARTVGGLLLLNGTFYRHSWAEVFLDDWVAVDPTYGQIPADAGHLRLVTGDLNRLLSFTQLTGTVQADVIEVRRQPR